MLFLSLPDGHVTHVSGRGFTACSRIGWVGLESLGFLAVTVFSELFGRIFDPKSLPLTSEAGNKLSIQSKATHGTSRFCIQNAVLCNHD